MNKILKLIKIIVNIFKWIIIIILSLIMLEIAVHGIYTIYDNINDNDEYIELSKIIQILLGYEIDNFNVAENIAQLYKLENYVTNNETWLMSYELEIGVNYYLNTYVLVK